MVISNDILNDIQDMTSQHDDVTVTSNEHEGEMLLCIRDANHLSDKEWILKVYLRSRGMSRDAFEEAEVDRGLEYHKYVAILHAFAGFPQSAQPWKWGRWVFLKIFFAHIFRMMGKMFWK